MSGKPAMTSSGSRNADKTTQVLFEISNAANKADNLDDLYRAIHTSLGKILNVDNFFIALYNDVKGSITFPYHVDEVDAYSGEVFGISKKHSLTRKVIMQAEPLLVGENELLKTATESSGRIIDTPPKIWMGVPLKIKDKTFGALVLQNYQSAQTYKKNDLDILNTVSGFVALSIERKRAETAQIESENTARTLFEISKAINTTENLNQLFETIYSSLKRTMDVTNFYIALYEKETKKITFPFHVDECDDLSEWNISYLKTESLTNEVFVALKPVLLKQKDLRIREKQNRIVGTTPLIWLGIPLLVRGEVKGIMVTQSYSDPDLYGQRDVDFLNSVSEQIAMAIERKTSENNIKQNEIITRTLFSISNAVNTSQDLSALYKSIHISLSKIIDLTNFIIGLYDKKTNTIHFEYYVDQFDDLLGQSLPLGRGSIGRDVIFSGKPLFLNEEAVVSRMQKNKGIGTWPKIWMGVPLKVDAEVIGYMAAQSYTDPYLFDQRDVDIFSSVSEQVALAIDRKRSTEEVAQNEILTRTLFKISNAVNTTLNLNDLYRSIHHSLGDVIDVTNFAIGIYDRKRDTISYPYYIDETGDVYSEIQNVSTSGILASEVINLAQPFFITKDEIKKRAEKMNFDLVGGLSEQWLGVPLKTQNEVIGVIVVQTYESQKHFQQKDADLLMAISDQVAIAIERKLAEEKILQNEILTQTLFRISNAVNTTDNLEDLYQSIYNSLNKLIKLPNFFLAVVNKGKKRLSFPFFIDEHDTKEDITKGLEKYEESTSNTSRIILSKKPLFLTNEMLKAKHKQKKTVGTNSKVWLGVPLIVRDDVIGVMVVQHYSDPEYFTKKDIELLTAVSEQVAMAIERKRSQENIKQSEQLTTTLFSISNAVNTTDRLAALFNIIYDALNVLIDLPNFFICIYQKKTNSMFFPFYIDEYDSEETVSFTIEDIDKEASITTDVIRSKKPMFLTENALIQRKKEKKLVGKLPVIWLGVPLIIRDQVVGVMAAQHYTDPEYFSPKDLDLFIAVSDQVALAIDRRQSQGIIIEREKQIIELSRQTQELSLVAASIISMKDDKRIFSHISKAIVENSDFQKLIISYFTEKPPYREILGYEGIGQHDIEKTKDISVTKTHFNTIFCAGKRIGNSACYLPHTKNNILSKDLLSVFTSKTASRNNSAWHPNDMLFIPMNDSDGNMMGVISVGNSKSGNMPTDETVRPLEIFSSLISQIIIVRRIQNELKDHKENLEKIVDGRTKELTTEIEERIEVEKMLKKAKIDAEAAAQAKIEFLANMSHEIRTPINGIMGMAEIALEKNLDDDLKQIFNTIDSEADQLLGIINEILDFSKIEAGKLSIEQIPFDLRITFEKTCSSLAMGIADEEIEFISFLSPDVPTNLIGDPGRLRQILVNLASNAIKFTHKGEIFIKGEIISTLGNTIELRFLIKDTGIGIAKEKQSSIFESFSQADGSTTREYGGTGLGTTISKQIVELMGGNIGLESEVDKGSVFWFTSKFTRQKEDFNKPPAALLGNLDSLKVLIVDNNKTNQYVFEEYLKSFGCIPVAVESGEKALICIKQEQNKAFDVVITNLTLPEMNGFELAQKIRTGKDFSRLPIIMLTSTGKLGDGSKCRDIGINGYLPKPVKKEELKTIIATVLGKIKDEKEIQEKLITRHTIAEGLAKKIDILLVEDYPTNQKIAMKHLTSVGYKVILAENGKIAVTQFKQKHFDLILMDIQMPEMDGYDATRHIRECEGKLADLHIATNGDRNLRMPRIPIIAMTAHAIEGYKEKCLAAGMDDYITKPLKKMTFLQMVEKWTPQNPKCRKPPIKSKKKIRIRNNKTNKPPFDYDKALDEFEDDKEFLKEVIDEFLEHLSTQLSKISMAISNNDPDAVEKEAHAIKGGAANLTAYPLSNSAHELELIGRSGVLDQSRTTFENMAEEFAKLKEHLLTLDF
ncbi:MAG: GAF domain-containing protein [Desulfobacula sp.]|nr:GAF domain-containing protein [Desulfobacula sp.]